MPHANLDQTRTCRTRGRPGPSESPEDGEELAKPLFGDREPNEPRARVTVQLGSAGGFPPKACRVRKPPAEAPPIVAAITTPSPSANLRGRNVLRDPLVRELLSARLICVLSTFDVRGIHAVAMWFALDGDHVVLATNGSSRKVRNLERDDRATIVVHDSRPGFEVCGVSIAGRVTVVRGESARPMIERVHGRYVAPMANELPAAREFLESDDTALCLGPDSAWTWDERGSEASAALRRSGSALPLVPTEPRPNTR